MGWFKGENKVSTETEVAAASIKPPSCFSNKDVKKVKDYLKWLNQEREANGDSYLTISEVDTLPELALNPFVGRVAEIVGEELQETQTKSDELTSEILLRVLGVFHRSTPIEDKMYYAFKVFDQDGDNVISRQDFVYALSAIHPGLMISELQEKTELVFEVCDREDDGYLTKDEFALVFDMNGFQQNFFIYY